MRDKLFPSTKVPILIYVGFVLFGCSRLSHVTYFKQSDPPSWSIILEQDNPTYSYQFNCESFSIRVGTLYTGEWMTIGPALVPLVPVSFLDPNDSLSIYLCAEISTPDSAITTPPELRLNADSSKTWLLPTRVNFMPERMYVAPRYITPPEKKKEFSEEHSRTCIYVFSLPKCPARSIRVSFTSPYMGCVLPSLSYIPVSETSYEPFVIPMPH